MIGGQLIDGVAPGEVFSPTNVQEISDALRLAMPDEAWLMPVGGGSAVTTGNAVDRVPMVLSLTGFNGIMEYEPSDLTVSVRAGTRWSELIAALAENGQTVPIDVPFPGVATVGGVVATGWAGPRRMRDGTIKDLLIGASFVRGDGLAAKAGGMVVKNVSGFEIPRLLHGSYGSLAVITSVNLKVVPIHEAELTLRSEAMQFRNSIEGVLRLTRDEPTLAAAVVDGDGLDGEIAIRLSGRRRPIQDLAHRIRSDYGELQLNDTIEDDDSAMYWQRRSDALATADDLRTMVEIGSTPVSIGSVIEQLRPELVDAGRVRYYVSPGIGAATVEFGSAIVSHESWKNAWNRTGLSANTRYVVLHAPRTWRSGSQMWSIPEDQRVMMITLKQQFDPEIRLNRGRLWDASTATEHVPAPTMESTS